MRSWMLAGLISVVSVTPTFGDNTAAHTRRDADPKAKSEESALSIRFAHRSNSAPATLRLMLQVPQHPDNRLLEVTIDSQEFYRSSEVQIDGDFAKRSHQLEWKGLPAGYYVVTARLFGSLGPRARVTREFIVLGPGLPDADPGLVQGRIRR